MEEMSNSSIDILVVVDTNTTNDTDDILISDAVIRIIFWIIYPFLCQSIDVFGTATNIINIICFVKQGFKDPVNVSLLALAISDLCCLIPLIWTNICMTPAFRDATLPFDPHEFQYLTGCWPHITFTRISSWITALIILERCLCITVPLKVKAIVTPRRVAIITLCVFTILTVSVAPVYTVSKLGMKFYPTRNTSLIGLLFLKNRDRVEKISFAINNIFVSSFSFLVIAVCTVILVVKLRSKTKWRKKLTTTTSNDNVTNRNQKAAKMVVMISVLFIACFIPVTFIFIVMSFDARISVDGKYKNTTVFLGGIGFVLESVNSSMNIFIYYRMSSKYRATFQQIFHFKNKSIKNLKLVQPLN